MADQNYFSSKYDLTKETSLKNLLHNEGFSFEGMDHALWAAKKEGIKAILYKSGKILVQGKGACDFASKYLGATHEVKPEINASKHESWIGTDESGKGDYFGPLVIAGVFVNKDNLQKLQELNIKDSKKINDELITKLAFKIKSCSTFSVITITPVKYNELYGKFKNLNSLLAWGHARAIENILEKKECKNALSDKFGNESLIKNALMKHGRTIELEQRHRAEDDIAVAAASILARNEFITRMDKMSHEYQIPFQKGASDKVKEQASEFIRKYGRENLKCIAKLHFKTTKELNI